MSCSNSSAFFVFFESMGKGLYPSDTVNIGATGFQISNDIFRFFWLPVEKLHNFFLWYLKFKEILVILFFNNMLLFILMVNVC